MFRRAVRGLACVAAAAAVGLGGYALVGAIGWQNALGLVGFQVVTVPTAPESQCNRAREQDDVDTEATACVRDAEWMKRYAESCAKREDSGLVYVDSDGVRVGVPKCSEQEQLDAQEALRRGISADTRVADLIESAG
jgi:hypothetical protein